VNPEATSTGNGFFAHPGARADTSTDKENTSAGMGLGRFSTELSYRIAFVASSTLIVSEFSRPAVAFENPPLFHGTPRTSGLPPDSSLFSRLFSRRPRFFGNHFPFVDLLKPDRDLGQMF
jgi:hypothetical protein